VRPLLAGWCLLLLLLRAHDREEELLQHPHQLHALARVIIVGQEPNGMKLASELLLE
jgi:hypothetical protein